MLDELKKICKEFHLNKLLYCILRLPTSSTFLKEFEVDILIKDTLLKNFHNILTAQGFQYSEDGILSHHHYRRDGLHLDLVICLCYGKKREHFVGSGYDVLEKAVFKDDMYFVDAVNEFRMLLLRCLFDKRSFTKHSSRIFQLIDSIGEEKCLREISSIFHSAK